MNSMTGFGRGEAVADGVVWRAELSSVNRKQLELVMHLPRELSELEVPLRNKLAEQLSRGRVQLNVNADRGAAAAATLRVDEALAKQYADALRRMSTTLGASPVLDASDFVRWPGVFALEQTRVRRRSRRCRMSSGRRSMPSRRCWPCAASKGRT